MGNQETIFFLIMGVTGVFLIAALYAFAYGLIARFGMNARLNALRSYWASFIGLVLGFLFLGAMTYAAYTYSLHGLGYVIACFGGLALIMTAINVLLLRTKEGAKINFIQAFMLQLVPNIILITYAMATRPSG